MLLGKNKYLHPCHYQFILCTHSILCCKENKSALLITGIVTLFSVVLLMVSMPLIRTQIYVQNHQSSTEEKAQTGTHYYEAIYNSPNTNTQEHRGKRF